MSGRTISLEDRQAIYDTLARYVWGMDTGDIAGVVATFTPDGVVKDVTGKRWDAAQPAWRAASRAASVCRDRRGRRLPRDVILGVSALGRGRRSESYPCHGELYRYVRAGAWPMADQGKDHSPME